MHLLIVIVFNNQGAICTNVPGTYECSCPDGTVPDPNPGIKCLEIVKCKIDDECPGNAFCDPEDRKCLCPEPNTGSECRRNIICNLKNKSLPSSFSLQFLLYYLIKFQILVKKYYAAQTQTACLSMGKPNVFASQDSPVQLKVLVDVLIQVSSFIHLRL